MRCKTIKRVDGINGLVMQRIMIVLTAGCIIGLFGSHGLKPSQPRRANSPPFGERKREMDILRSNDWGFWPMESSDVTHHLIYPYCSSK